MTKPDRQKILTELRQARDAKGYSQEEVADRIGVSQSTYFRLENRKGKMEMECLQQIAAVLDMDLVKLLGRGEDITHKKTVQAQEKYLSKKDDIIETQQAEVKYLRQRNIKLGKKIAEKEAGN